MCGGTSHCTTGSHSACPHLAGLRTWRLEVCRAPNVVLGRQPLDAFNMVPSPRKITNIVLVGSANEPGEVEFTVGRVPAVR